MNSIGEILRQERLRQGLELQQVSDYTKISRRMLQAMEQNDFTKLPGGVFTRSFIKQYAAALNLSPATLEFQLSQLQTEAEEPAKSDLRKDIIPERSHYSLSDYNASRNSNSLLASLLWVALALLVTGAVYFIMNRTPGSHSETAKAVDKKAEPAQPEESKVEVKSAEPAALPTASGTSPVQLTITAKESSWVSISVDGKSQFVGVLQPEEQRNISAEQKVKLVTGNAGGLELQLNGTAVEQLGPKGQIRTAEFTTAGAHVVPRTPPNPAPLP